MHKHYTNSYIYNGNSESVFRFSVKQSNIRKKQSQNEHLGQFFDKSDEIVVREKTYLPKLDFYKIDRKMKSIIRCIFISIIMHQNFMPFRQFKSALESFPSVNGHLRTVLKNNFISLSNF